MENQILLKLQEGKSVKSIATLLNLPYYQVQKIAIKTNFNYIDFKKQQVLKWSSKTPNEICKILGYGRPFVLKTLKENNLPLEGSGGKNRICNDISMFTDLTPDTYYWLGVIISDGNLTKVKYNVSIIQKDLDLHEKFLDFINLKNKIKIQYNTKSQCSTTTIGHKELYKFLNSLGITSVKSKTVNPNFNLTWDFIRGLWDGDGHFSGNRSGFVTASPFLFEKVCNFLKGKILYNSWEEISSNGTKLYRLSINSIETKKFIKYLYKGANYYLNRKFEKACQIVQVKPCELLETL